MNDDEIGKFEEVINGSGSWVESHVDEYIIETPEPSNWFKILGWIVTGLLVVAIGCMVALLIGLVILLWTYIGKF